MFRKLVHEAEEIAHEAEEICEEVEKEAEEVCEEVEKEAEEICEEVEEVAEDVEQDVEKKVQKLVRSATDAGVEGEERLKSIRKSLGGDKKEAAEDDHQKHPFVDSVWFTASITAMTMCNTLQMGLEVDHPDWTTAWTICENVFTFGFAFEMVCKLCAYKWHYFTDTANWLDGSLSLLGILDCWIFALIFSGGGVDLQSLSVLRILRLLRLARLMKLIRSFKPLVLVIQGVMKAMTSAFYVLSLCILIFYVFAIFLTQHMGHSHTDVYPGYSTVEEVIDEQEVMQNYNPHICWGNMISSMLTLFNMAILAEWSEVVRPIFYKQPMYLPVFLFFATCVGFGVMNVLIAVIVDVVTAESRRIETDYRDQVKKKKLKTLDKIQNLLADIDRNKDGVLEVEELAHGMENNDLLKELLASIDLPRGWSSDELLDMLDNNGDGVLQYGEFTTSFFRLLDSDDFQQICIMQSSINQVKHLIREQNKTDALKHAAVESDLASIKAALGIAPRKVEHQPSHLHLSHERSGSSLGKPNSLPPGTRAEEQSSAACKESCANPGNAKPVAVANTVREITKEELVGSAIGAPTKSQEGELISRTQLKEVLSSALNVVKECIHEEFAAVKPGLESEVSSLLEAVRRFGDHWGPQEIPASLKPTTEHTDRLKGSKSNDSVNGALASDFPGSASRVTSLRAQYERCEYPGNDIFADHSNPAQPDFATGGYADSVLPEGHIREAGHPRQYCVHEFIFDKGIQRLGFEVQWVKDGLPLVTGVVPDGAANIQGLLQGDQIAECNGMSTAGKERREVLQVLGMRPLALSILRA